MRQREFVPILVLLLAILIMTVSYKLSEYCMDDYMKKNPSKIQESALKK